jgi:hypothetical protein
MVKKKIYFTDEKYLHFEAKLNSYDLEVSINYNERIRLLFQNIIEPSLSWFSTEIIGTNANVAINIKTLNDNCVLPITMNSLLVHFNKVRNELSHADPQILGKEEFDYFNVQTRKFIKYFKPEGLKENRNPISEAEKDFEIVEIDILDSNDPRYLGKYGHYKINNEEFISIYGFKNKFGLSGNDKNGNEALQILEQGIKSYKSVPEIGKFRVVRVFPLLFLQGFYKSEKTNKMKALIDEEYYSLINGLDAIRTLIIGQDPYPFGAMGIAFCTNDFPLT